MLDMISYLLTINSDIFDFEISVELKYFTQHSGAFLGNLTQCPLKMKYIL